MNIITAYATKNDCYKAARKMKPAGIVVQNNLSEIRAAQEEYLKEITKKLEEAGLKIDKGDEFEDDD